MDGENVSRETFSRSVCGEIASPLREWHETVGDGSDPAFAGRPQVVADGVAKIMTPDEKIDQFREQLALIIGLTSDSLFKGPGVV
jgi:hypothetical protein